MSYIQIISIFFVNIVFISCYLDGSVIPRVEHTNILNKGVWLRNKFKDADQTNKLADFIFRPNSLDVDNLLQGNFNAFEDNDMHNMPFLPNYMERYKRSNDVRNRKGIKNSGDNKPINENDIDLSLVKSKMITKLKPASVFNDYPFEIAMLLGHNGIELVKPNITKYEDTFKEDNYTLIHNHIKEKDSNSSKNRGILKVNENFKDLYNISNGNLDIPIRRQSKYEDELIKKVDFTEELNTTDKKPKIKVDRDVFDENIESSWHQSAPVSNVNRYQVIPRVDELKKVKPMTERGLVKVLSMLTKTFKKIMRQHNDIKEVHRKIHDMNTDFLRNIVVITEKFKDFDEKYLSLLNFNKRIKVLEDQLKTKERHVKTKEKELSQNLVDFESQQKKFLNQQRQFYNIQKLMLAQNEKINNRQNMIARTQSEISQRQNNFARILKKAKQIYIDKHPAASKLTTIFTKIRNNTDMKTEDLDTTSTTPAPVTDSIKINLFSIPSEARLENQDELLLNEKDDETIDDLVYKYYFNNTFIDNLMKTSFLSSLIPVQEYFDTKNNKNKRQQASELGTTVLLPVNKPLFETKSDKKSLNRERRWIGHHTHKKSRKHKQITDNGNIINDEKTDKKQQILIEEPTMKQKSEPFMTMAKSFCNGIGQNSSQQVLYWCIEKTLRRLENIGDTKTPPPPSEKPDSASGFPSRINGDTKTPPSLSEKPDSANDFRSRMNDGGTTQAFITIVHTTTHQAIQNQNKPHIDAVTTQTSITILPSAYISTSLPIKASQVYDMFFPDNDQLESNLKQYGEAPDMEGNVYFDGSLHASDVIRSGPSSGGSDILPGLESNSRIDDIDPMTLDTQAMRRAFVNRLQYENMLKTMSRITP